MLHLFIHLNKHAIFVQVKKKEIEKATAEEKEKAIFISLPDKEKVNKYLLLTVKFLATRTKILRLTDIATTTASLLRVVAVLTTGVDIVFQPISCFRNLSDIDKSCVVFMERYEECESVILVPPLQFNEGF